MRAINYCHHLSAHSLPLPLPPLSPQLEKRESEAKARLESVVTREQAAAARMVELSQAREGVEAAAAAAEKEKAKLAAERAELEAREKSIARKVGKGRRLGRGGRPGRRALCARWRCVWGGGAYRHRGRAGYGGQGEEDRA